MTIRKIGRFEVISEIGRGGMSTVYKARDPQFKRDVAIKILPHELLHDISFRERFNREATTIASLEHPGIVPVYDFGEEDGQPFLVLRLIGGGSLKDRIGGGPLPLEEVTRIITSIAPALDYAHQKGVVHRDLKPENVLFDQQSEPYLSDFGIAKLAESTATLTGKAIVGTPAYMSPEQGRGDANIDHRSDIYSLGVMLFEMLTGIKPYEAKSPTGQIMKHLTEPVPNILAANPNLPEGCQTVIDRSMAKKKIARFASAGEFAAALDAAAKGDSIPPAVYDKPTVELPQDYNPPEESEPQNGIDQQFTPPPEKKIATIPESKRRGLTILQIVFIAIILFALGFGGMYVISNTILTPTPKPTIPIAEAPTSSTTPEIILSDTPLSTTVVPPAIIPTETPEPTFTHTSTDVPTEIPSPTITPTRTPTPTPTLLSIGGADKLAFVSSGDIWISNIDGSDTQRLTTTGGLKRNLQWSPDGEFLTYIQGLCVHSVNIVDRISNTILCVNWVDSLGGFEISPDGEQVALSLSDGVFILPYDLYVLSSLKTRLQLEAAEKCTSYTDAPTKTARWSKDGKKLAVIVEITQQGRKVEIVKVLEVSRCGEPPTTIDEFPADRFEMNRYDINPVIIDLAWDGEALFALAVHNFNEFGEIYIYNIVDKRAEVIVPAPNWCCYRGFQWSPDGVYFIFAYQDARFVSAAHLYYVIYGTIGTGEIINPIEFTQEILTGARENPQPALRPAPGN